MKNSSLQTNNPDSVGQISFKEMILNMIQWCRYLWKRKVLVGITVATGLIAGYVYAQYADIKFRSITTFVLENGESSGGLSQYAGIASMVGIDLSGGSGGIFQGENILELYKSRNMIQKTLLTKGSSGNLLIDDYLDIFEKKREWAQNPVLKNFKFRRSGNSPMINRVRDSILGSAVYDILKKNLSVTKPDKKLNIIKVEVVSPDEGFSKTFNDALVNTVNGFYIQTRTKRSMDNVNILQRKTDSVRRVMTGAIYSAAEVADQTPNLNPTRQALRTAPIQRSQFSAESNKAILSALVQNLELARMNLLKETPLIQVVDNPTFPLEVVRLGKIKGAVLGAFFAFLILVIFFIGKESVNYVMR